MFRGWRNLPAATMFATCALAATLGVWLRVSVPTLPMWGSARDDQMQLGLASSLIHGRWLGQWTEPLLSKGAGYPLFLLFAHWLGISPTVLAFILYLCGAALVALGVQLWLQRPVLSTVSFVLLAFNPAMFGAASSQIYREAWAASLAIIVLGLTMIATWLIRHRLHDARWYCAFGACLIGLCITVPWMTITRIDTLLWVGTCAAILAIATIFLQTSNARDRLVRAGLTVAAVAVVGMATAGLNSAIADRNQQLYGARVVDDFTTGAFADANNSWASVVAGTPRDWVPVTRAQREAVYAVSPTARILEKYLEIPDGTGFKQWPCQSPAKLCDEAGNWFPWMLRDAAVRAAPIRNEADFQTFFGKLNNEIEAACADRKLTCAEPGIGPGMPRPELLRKSLILGNIGLFARADINFTAGAHAPVTPIPPTELIRYWESVVGPLSYTAGNGSPWNNQPVVSTLRWIYAAASWILLIPALIGLFWGAVAGGLDRAASVLGLAALAGVLGQCAILGLFMSAAYPVPSAGLHYQISAESYLILALAIGTWVLAGRTLKLVAERESQPASVVVGDGELVGG